MTGITPLMEPGKLAYAYNKTGEKWIPDITINLKTTY